MPPPLRIKCPLAFPRCLPWERQEAMGGCPFGSHHLLAVRISLPRKGHPQPRIPLERHWCCESGSVFGKPYFDGSTLFLSHKTFHTRRLLVDPAGHCLGVGSLTPARALLNLRLANFTRRPYARPRGGERLEEIHTRRRSALAAQIRKAAILNRREFVEAPEWVPVVNSRPGSSLTAGQAPSR